MVFEGQMRKLGQKFHQLEYEYTMELATHFSLHTFFPGTKIGEGGCSDSTNTTAVQMTNDMMTKYRRGQGKHSNFYKEIMWRCMLIDSMGNWM